MYVLHSFSHSHFHFSAVFTQMHTHQSIKFPLFFYTYQYCHRRSERHAARNVLDACLLVISFTNKICFLQAVFFLYAFRIMLRSHKHTHTEYNFRNSTRNSRGFCTVYTLYSMGSLFDTFFIRTGHILHTQIACGRFLFCRTAHNRAQFV